VGTVITLPGEVSAKIAAGEVIEGPYSVVRELLDNAIDAGSAHIRIVTSNGGKDLIQVTDDGSGMSAEDARLAVREHTTSKIRNIEDLNSITSMGFRGEALASICTVSDFTLITRRSEDPHGIRILCKGGGPCSAEPAAANPGTEIMVRNLFHNLPARRKFLRSNRAEAARVREEIVKKSLSFHGTGFSYRADDRAVLTLDPQESPLERIVELFGGPFRNNLLPLSHDEELFTVRGYISNKKLTLPNRRGQFLFINGRPVTDRSLLFAVNNPGRGLVPPGRYLYAFVFITIDPALVDVNVHPAKKEVKIRPAERLHSAVHRSVQRALSEGPFPTKELLDAPFQHPIGASGERVYVYHGLHGRERAGFDTPLQTVRNGAFDVRPASPIDGLPFERTVPPEARGGLLKIPEGGFEYRGSLFNCFLIFESGSTVILVDQHAAHERICYERFKRIRRQESGVRRLLIPLNFTPPASKYQVVLDAVAAFRQADMEIEPFGDESFNILTLPSFIPENREEETVSQVFEELYEGNLQLDAEEIGERFLMRAACRAAVKEGDALSQDEARALFGDLLVTEMPTACPHGRPTMIRYSIEYFEKLFKRR
jgi:DNA mismatch repair protein MutL